MSGYLRLVTVLPSLFTVTLLFINLFLSTKCRFSKSNLCFPSWGQHVDVFLAVSYLFQRSPGLKKKGSTNNLLNLWLSFFHANRGLSTVLLSLTIRTDSLAVAMSSKGNPWSVITKGVFLRVSHFHNICPSQLIHFLLISTVRSRYQLCIKGWNHCLSFSSQCSSPGYSLPRHGYCGARTTTRRIHQVSLLSFTIYSIS